VNPEGEKGKAAVGRIKGCGREWWGAGVVICLERVHMAQNPR